MGGAHGDIILERKHFKCIFQSQLIPTDADEKEIEKLKEYMQTDEYIANVAREKLGMVKENEIIFSEGK